MQSGVRTVKAGVRAVAGLMAAHLMIDLGMEVEFRWIPDECDVDGALEWRIMLLAKGPSTNLLRALMHSSKIFKQSTNVRGS